MADLNDELKQMSISFDHDEIERAFIEKCAKRDRQAGKARLMAAASPVVEGEETSITILVDFPVFDEDCNIVNTLWQQKHAETTVEDVDEMLNGDGWDPDNNVCSVKSYYRHISGGRFTLKNVIVGPVLLPHERSYYDDSDKNCVDCAGKLIVDMFSVIKADPDYDEKYRKKFCLGTLNTGPYGSGSYVKTLNIMFSGAQATTWSQGLWAFSHNLGSLFGNEGIYSPDRVFEDDDGQRRWFHRFQICSLHSWKSRNTCIHESGHTVFGWPDMYASNTQNGYGLGYYCLMAYGGNRSFPGPVNPFLLEQNGWITPIDVTDYTRSRILSLPADGSTVYKYRNKNNPDEYFLIDHREKCDGCVDEGIFIWRVNKSGSNYSGSRWITLNSGEQIPPYMVTLLDPDKHNFLQTGTDSTILGGWGVNGGSLKLNDDTIPSTRWKNDDRSGLNLSDFTTCPFAKNAESYPPGAILLSPNTSDTDVEVKTYKYTGDVICPAVQIAGLTRNVDYIVQYFDNVEIGTGRIEITGIGGYREKHVIYFKIEE